MSPAIPISFVLAALVGLSACAGQSADDVETAAGPESVSAAPETDPESAAPGTAESAMQAGECGCGARSPGQLLETQQQLLP